jgi:hypothetical protein
MTIFDLLFIALFFTVVVLLVAAAVSALRGRRARAIAILSGLGVLIGVYFVILILVSLLSPRRVLNVGVDQCWDDWCIAVTDVRRAPADTFVSYVVTLRVSSRARRRAQRERGVVVYLLDDRDRRYEPVVDTTAVPFDVMLQPQEAVTSTRAFEIPTDARKLVLVVAHAGRFPGCCIISDSQSLLHKRTAVRLD